jgi:hypothetical protein
LTAGNDVTSVNNDTANVQQDGTENTRELGSNSSVREKQTPVTKVNLNDRKQHAGYDEIKRARSKPILKIPATVTQLGRHPRKFQGPGTAIMTAEALFSLSKRQSHKRTARKGLSKGNKIHA